MDSQNGTNITSPISSASASASAEVNVQTCILEKVITVFQNIGYLMSFGYLIWVYYYFWTKGVYTLQKKNLLSLCVNLSALYSLSIVDMCIKIPNFLVIISCCEITTTVLLFVMSMDTCVNLRRGARNMVAPAPMQMDDGTRDCRFFSVYTFCSWILAQSVAYALAYLYDDFLLILVDFHLIAYTVIFFMFFVSLYNIKPATVNLGTGHRNFTIFGRTLIITFVTSSIKFAFAVIFYATGKQVDSLLFLDCLMAYDGVFIYYCLTFNNKKSPPPAAATTTASSSRLHGTSQLQVYAITNNHALQNAANNDNRNHHHRNNINNNNISSSSSNNNNNSSSSNYNNNNNNNNNSNDEDDGHFVICHLKNENSHAAASADANT